MDVIIVSKTSIFAIKGFFEGWKWVCALVLLCTLACTKSPSDPGTNQTIRYRVAVPRMPAESVSVEVEISSWGYGDSVQLIMPPVYADNPLHPAEMPYVSAPVIRGADSNDVPYRADSILIGNHTSPCVHFTVSQLPASISYWVKFAGIPQNTDHFSPPPFVGESKGYLQGNYLFAIPSHSADMVELWRTPLSFEVEFEIGEGLSFYGEPRSGAVFNTPYELMFSTSYFCSEILSQGTAGGQDFLFLHFRPETTLVAGVAQNLKTTMEKMLGKLCPAFGTIDAGHPITVAIDGVRWMGGHEGTRGFSIYHPLTEDTLGVFDAVMAHEILHFWVGIRTGDKEDPWWKEGTTEYLGIQVACELGLAKPSYASFVLLEDMSKDPKVLGTALSDPSVRKDLFSRDTLKDQVKLVYYKGAQVSMLLDRAIRVSSGGVATLFDAVAVLCRQFDGKAFTRSDYVTVIQNISQADVGEIFSEYVDKAGVIPDSVLAQSYQYLAAQGAFGPPAIAKKACRNGHREFLAIGKH